VVLAACGSPSAELVQSTPSESANPASASPAATPVATDALIAVARQIYPQKGDQYVTCDSGYGGSTRYSQCPVTTRLRDRLLTVFVGISSPEPLGGGQDPEWPMESVTAEASGTGGVAHVVLTKPDSPSSRYDLAIISFEGQLLVDDIYCTGADPATSSIYVDGWGRRYLC
jgi:hypothetical protein